jgi:hypothetical protein
MPKEWLRETHGAGFELLRHFLLHFFDSDLVTAPGQTAAELIGAVSIFLPWFPFVTGPLKEKYAHLSAMAVAGPYRQAIRADELWLITLMMSAIGLLTAIKWNSLFPGLGDYRAIGSLPVRPRQIFGAKLLAVSMVATAAVILLNLAPVLGFPMVTASRWAIQPAIGGRLAAIAVACVSGCYFFFFALVAAQGVLLNLRIGRWLQGLLAGGMLILIVGSFSIQPQMTAPVLRPEFARWIPPVWYLGLCQKIMGDPDPEMHALAHRALVALLTAVGLVLAAYTLSYRGGIGPCWWRA